MSTVFHPIRQAGDPFFCGAKSGEQISSCLPQPRRPGIRFPKSRGCAGATTVAEEPFTSTDWFTFQDLRHLGPDPLVLRARAFLGPRAASHFIQDLVGRAPKAVDRVYGTHVGHLLLAVPSVPTTLRCRSLAAFTVQAASV